MDINTRDQEVENKDAVVLSNILPDEVWYIVLQRLGDSKDSVNVCNASLYFRRLLLNERVLFLFPNVWNIIGLQLPLTYWKTLKKKSRCRGRLRETLKLRTVCRQWKGGIDEYFQSEMFYWNMEAADYTVKSDERIMMEAVTNIFGNEAIAKFLEHFQATHSTGNLNPFIVRSVVMEPHFSADDRRHLDYIGSIDKFIGLYGDHIWRVQLYIKNILHALNLAYYKLSDWLLKMPNLRYLTISFQSRSEEVSGSMSDICVLPLPRLKCLTHLGIGHVEKDILENILKSYNHVSVLDLSWAQNLFKDSTVSLSFPNLSELGFFINSESQMKALESLKLHWNLEKLCVSFEKVCDWQRIFTMVSNNWQSTLKRLVVSLPTPPTNDVRELILKESASFRLNLPMLEELHVSIGTLSSMDFLLPLASRLANLNVQFRYARNVQPIYETTAHIQNKQLIDFLGYTDKMQESNIWQLFPRLESIIIDEDVADRNSKGKEEFHRLKHIGI